MFILTVEGKEDKGAYSVANETFVGRTFFLQVIIILKLN